MDYNKNSGYGLLNAISMFSGKNAGGWTYGKNLYVLKSTDTDNYDRIAQIQTGDNEGTTRIFNTVTAALAVAQDNDRIFVGPGVFDEGAELVISQSGLKLIGCNTSGIEWGPCSLKQSSANHHIISVQANGVEIAGLGFIVNGAYRAIEIDHTAAVYKTHIHDCHFGGSATATYGVYAGGTFDAVDTVIEDNEFLAWATAGVYLNGTRCKVRRNVFFVPASGIGIEYVPNGGDRPYGVVSDNDITGANSSDTGIKLTGTPTASTLQVNRNNVVNCATPITASKNTFWYDSNFFGKNDKEYHSELYTWFVDAGITASGDGKCPASAFKTITEALAVAGTFDTIKIAGGDYDEGAVLNITTEGLKLIGPGSDNRHVAMIYSSSASHHLVTVNAHNVEIAGLGFTQTKDNYDGIRVSSTDSYFKCHIHDCRFDGYDTGEYAIHTGTTYDSPDLVVERNVIRNWATAGIYANATRAIYRKNTIHILTDAKGIEFVPNGTDRPDNVVVDNDFTGLTSSTTIGINFVGVPTDGALILSRNYFGGTYNTSIEKTASYHGVNNYVADAAGGALIDTVT